jgi:hypothetical protein
MTLKDAPSDSSRGRRAKRGLLTRTTTKMRRRKKRRRRRWMRQDPSRKRRLCCSCVGLQRIFPFWPMDVARPFRRRCCPFVGRRAVHPFFGTDGWADAAAQLSSAPLSFRDQARKEGRKATEAGRKRARLVVCWFSSLHWPADDVPLRHAPNLKFRRDSGADSQAGGRELMKAVHRRRTVRRIMIHAHVL